MASEFSNQLLEAAVMELALWVENQDSEHVGENLRGCSKKLAKMLAKFACHFKGFLDRI